MSDKIIKLNTDPAVVLAFVDMMRSKLASAPYEEGEKDRDWALSVVDDIKTMCTVVTESIVEPDGTPEKPFVMPMPGPSGPKS